MRGSPLFRALFSVVVLLALAVPLSQLTRARQPLAVSSPTGDEFSLQEVKFRVEFTLLPHSVKVSHLGHEIWKSNRPEAEVEGALRIAWPAEGVDLRWQIAWPEQEAMAAARIHLTGPDGTVHERSLWSRGLADEVLTFP